MELPEKQKTNTWIYVLTGVLYLITAVLGIMSFLAGRRTVLSTLSRFGAGGSQNTAQNPFSLFNILVSFPLAFLVIAIVIGGFEYHHRNAGTKESWRMFSKTLGVEFGILLLALFL
jgi:uncharacterized membrane protein HdeD (DUF308 family)